MMYKYTLESYTVTPMTPAQYEKTFTLLEQYCDCFSLTDHHDPFSVSSFKDEIAPYQKSTFQTTHWFCFYMDEETPLQICLYPICPETVKILHQSYHPYFSDCLENREPGFSYFHRLRRPNLEDLCFFKSGELVFGSVTHEYIYHFYSDDEGFINNMLQIYPYWEKADEEFARRSEREHIRLKDYQNCIIG